ncbi:MAG: type II toxin-antitoxin system VapC family toxin [Candidatus Electronema sp. V4]|uniref:type II toxin-antitoxin system VapC family toxin n=1 Tax=Candidatus Electronema sp. V4 TaxID=3454756 RepID=UPI0040555194
MRVFVDTGAWIALADKNDRYHDAAKNLYASIQKRKIQLVITDYIFDETATWLHYKIGHQVACDWGNRIFNSSMVEIVKVSEEHIDAAWKLFQKYSDQKFSFTDCISFVVMNLIGIKDVFTYDSHFSTMGFCVIGQLQ